jgi:iron complex transport system substrate-binding protein
MKKIILIIVFFLLIHGKANAAERYVSLAPSTTEILFALGLSDEIVGVSSYCNYPLEARAKVKTGDFSHPNIEKIVSLKPDYIFCTGLEQAPVIRELKRLNFNVYVSDPSSIEGLLVSIEEIGNITNRRSEAKALIKKMRDDINEVNSKAKLIPPEKKIKVFIEIWHEPLMTAGNGSFVDELITLAGGNNIAHEIKRPYSSFSAEKVVGLNPGCIIMAYMDRESPLRLVSGRFGWNNIDAVKNKRIYNDIDPDILLRPGPRITEGLKEIYKRLYP